MRKETDGGGGVGSGFKQIVWIENLSQDQKVEVRSSGVPATLLTPSQII